MSRGKRKTVEKELLPTSRSTNPLPTSFSIDHGIGNVVVTFKALLNWSNSVNKNSTPACMAMPKQMLNKLNPTTIYHSDLAPLLDVCTPPVLVGRACVPCVLKLTATLGTIESRAKKNSEGMRKKISRMPNTATTSTFKGGWESTKVLQV